VAFPVYSVRLFAGSVTPSNTRILLGTVGTGKRAIIRDVRGGQTVATNSYLDLYLNPGGPLLLRVFPDTNGVLALSNAHIVLHEGEQLHGYARTNTCQVAVYGYSLEGSGAPGFPAALPA